MSDLTPEPLDAEQKTDVTPKKGVMGVLFLIVFMDLLGFGVIIPLLPFYAERFNASGLQVGLLFSVYSICQLLASPVLGMISDRYGRRPVLIYSQLGSAFGYVLLGVVSQLHFENATIALLLVYLSRLIDGISGGNISTAQAYISDITTKENRSKGMGMLGAAFGLGFAAGPLLGGILGHQGAHWPAYAAAILSLGAMGMTIAKLPETRSHQRSDSEMLLHPSRLLPIWQKPILRHLLLISFTTMGAFVMMEAVAAIFMKKIFHFEELQVGWFFGYVGLIILFVQGFAIGKLTKKFGEWPLAIAGPALVTVGMLMYVAATYHPAIWVLGLAGLFNATGRSFFQPSLSSLTSQFSDPDEQGATFGLAHSLMSLSRVFGPALAGWAYDRHVTSPFWISGILSAFVAIWVAIVWVKVKSPIAQQSPVPQ